MERGKKDRRGEIGRSDMGDGSGVNGTLVATNEPQARKTDKERV